MAIVVTAKVLGAELGIARAVGAILFALVIGAIMHLLYRHEEAARAAKGSAGSPPTTAAVRSATSSPCSA